MMRTVSQALLEECSITIRPVGKANIRVPSHKLQSEG